MTFPGLALMLGACALFSWRALVAGAVSAAVCGLGFIKCRRMLGGVSGDIAGFSVSIAQIAGLVAAVI